MSEKALKLIDRVSPAINGYYRIPAIWVGSRPKPPLVRYLNPEIHHETVLRKQLQCGISVRVQRDGLFLFNFSNWERAPVVRIPGYEVPRENNSVGHKAPKKHYEAEKLASAFAVFRAKIMNAHQACFTTVEMLIYKRGASMGLPVHSQEMHSEMDIEAPLPYAWEWDIPRALSQNVLNNSFNINWQKAPDRRVVETDLVEKSFDLLDNILLKDDDRLIDLFEGLYIASVRGHETRLGEALTLAWAVCEQILYLAWGQLIKEVQDSETAGRMNRERRKKLDGRDYTASVVIELLELNGKISTDLYKKLEIARKARNAWAHRLETPTRQAVQACMSAGEDMMQLFHGLPLRLNRSAEAGFFPRWPAEA